MPWPLLLPPYNSSVVYTPFLLAIRDKSELLIEKIYGGKWHGYWTQLTSFFISGISGISERSNEHNAESSFHRGGIPDTYKTAVKRLWMALIYIVSMCCVAIKHEKWFYIWALGWMVYIIARMTGAQCLIWRAGPYHRYRFIQGVGICVHACMCGHMCVFWGFVQQCHGNGHSSKGYKIHWIEARGWKRALPKTIGRQHDRQPAVLCVYCQPPTHPQVFRVAFTIILFIYPRIWQPLRTRPAPHICGERGRGEGNVLRAPCVGKFSNRCKTETGWSRPNPEPEHIGIGIISSVPHIMYTI